MERQIISIGQLAEFLNISARAVHFKLQAGEPILGVDSYSKLDPEKKTSAYVIYANEDYKKPKKRKK